MELADLVLQNCRCIGSMASIRNPSFLLLALLAVAAYASFATGQTEPFLVTKARQTRAFAANCTRDSANANATAALRAQDVIKANATLANATAAYNDALPLVNRLKVVLANRIAAKNATAAAIPALQNATDEAQAQLDKLVAQGTDETSLLQAVEDAKRRANMTSQLVDDQQGEVADANIEAIDAAKKAADSSLTGAELATAQAKLAEAMAVKAQAEAILKDMVDQANRAADFLVKRQNDLDNPDAVQAELLKQQQAVADAKADLDAGIAADAAAATAVTQAQFDVNYASASIPAKSANVSNAKILLNKAITAKTSADNNSTLMASRATNAIIAAQQAEAAAKAAGYTWVW
ncbi:unnamed protein product [Closterium sp. NIES-64]|nr:unnamed protein product [Closterium sp. NIES-64]